MSSFFISDAVCPSSRIFQALKLSLLAGLHKHSSNVCLRKRCQWTRVIGKCKLVTFASQKQKTWTLPEKASQNILHCLIVTSKTERAIKVQKNAIWLKTIAFTELNGNLKAEDKLVLGNTLTSNILYLPEMTLERASFLLIDGQAFLVVQGKFCGWVNDLAKNSMNFIFHNGCHFIRNDVILGWYRSEFIKERTRGKQLKELKPFASFVF